MRPSSNSYRIEISPTAWARLGQVPQEVFARIQRELTELAKGSSGIRAADHGRNEVIADGYTAQFDIDPTSRVVTLLDVTARLHLAE